MLDMINSLLKAVCNPPAISGDTLKFNLRTTKPVGAIYLEPLSTLFDICASLAMALTIVYFLIEMNRRWVFEASDVTLKTIFVPFLKLLAAVGLITHAKQIAVATMSVFNEMVDVLEEEVYDSWDAITLSGLGLIACAFILLPLLIVWLVSLVIQFAYWYKVMGFKLEFYYRAAVTPIAMADIYNDFSSGSIRWIKSLFAFGLYGLAFLVLPPLCKILVADVANVGSITTMISDSAAELAENVFLGIWDFIKALVCGLLAPMAALGTLSVVKQLTKEAVGG